jgi:polysaccharide biosynthesis/export protein
VSTFIERAFSDLQGPLTVDRNLRQFGYNLFEGPLSTFAPVQDVPVGPDYVIGPGDTLFVNVWGLAEMSLQAVVDRNGEIFLPKAGPLRVWGLKFAEMETLISDQLFKYFTGIKVSITMGPLRTMKIFILGEVVKPGAYTVSSLSTVTNAIFAAGGPSTQGSLRDIRLIRNNRIISRLDLYTFLLEGSRRGDDRLMPDDTIFVPPIGRVVALAGYVKRPAIYELKEEMTLAKLLEMGGGLTILSYIKRVQVERVSERQRKVVLDDEFTDMKDFEAKTAAFPLQEGDFVSVFPIERSLYSYVGLEGNVRRSGIYALKPNMRIKDLIEQGEGLMPGSHMARADLARFHDGRRFETIPVDLAAVMAGDPRQNFPLNQFDRVIVYHELDIRPQPLVQITGSVYRPGVFELTPNMWVSDLVFKGNPTRQASFRNAEMYRAEPGATVRVIRLDLEQILANPRSEKDVELTDRDHVFIRELAEGVEKRTVSITGRVRFPGEYAITSEERLSSLLQRVGGFLPEAFPKGAIFTRQSIREIEQQQLDKFIKSQEQALLADTAATTAGTSELVATDKSQIATTQAAVASQRRELLRSLASAVVLGRLAIQLDAPEKIRGTANDILLENGDSLVIPQTPTSIVVLGAVRNSTAILYGGEQNVDYYVAQAGGPSPEADVDQTYIVKANGTAIASFVKVRKVEVGDAIIVPINTEPKIRALPMLRDIATILTGFALPFASIVALLK